MLAPLLALALVALPVPALALDYDWVRNGHVEAIDGNTVRFDGRTYRLYGIDAPDLGQTCRKPDGSEWQCGRMAKDFLAGLIGNDPARCFGIPNPVGVPGIDYVICRNEKFQLNASMVFNGFALADRRVADKLYLADERGASRFGHGIWAGTFDPPWVWRSRKRGI